MVQCVSILGSTGSIGRQSLDIIRRLPGIRVAALTAGTNVERMAQQCREFSPKLAVMATQEAAQALAERIKGLPIRVNFGEAGLMEAASMADADCVITAVVGMVGLKPTLAAIRAKKRIGLANKETLVCKIMMGMQNPLYKLAYALQAIIDKSGEDVPAEEAPAAEAAETPAE